MDTSQSRLTLSRRGFFKLTAGVAVTAAAAHLLDTYSPWLDYGQQAATTARPLVKEAPMSEKTRELVRYATLAANGHNTQPWKFALRDDSIEIHPDASRRLPVVDPDDRELWISLGCALENLLVAARATGYAAAVTYPGAAEFIGVRLEADAPQSSPLFDAIPSRQTTRSVYDGRPAPAADLDRLQAMPLEPGITLRFVTDPVDMATVADYVAQGNRRQYADRAFVSELIAWLRFNKKEALSSLDGLYSRCSGNPEVPRWLGRMFVSSTQPQQQADADTKKLRSSPGAVVVASDADDKVAWVRTGQVYERLALQMTALGIQSALLNQPIEAAELRGPFQSALGLGQAAPQLLLRYGYAAALPRSLRRPVEQVLM